MTGQIVSMLVVLAVAGIQTLRLSAETTAHAQNKTQWALEAAQNARQLTRLGDKYRATERNLQERANAALDSYFLAAKQGELARADAVRATERLRQLASRATDAAGRLPATAASSLGPGADCSAQLAACGQLLAQGASLVASGASVAADGGELVGRLDAQVTLCRAAWPESREDAP